MSAEKPAPSGASFSGKSNGSRLPEAITTSATHQARIDGDEEVMDPLAVDEDTVNEGAGEGSLPFPIECLPPTMRVMVQETAKQTRTPYALSAVVALGVASAAIGRGLLVKSGGSRTTAGNLYLLAIARSGVGKGQTFSIVSKPLYTAETEALTEWKTSQMPTLEASFEVSKAMAKKAREKAVLEKDEELRKYHIEGLAALEEEQKRLEEKKNSSPCYVVGDITREALAMRLASQPNEALACFSSEARGILSVIRGRYGNGDSSDEDIYLSAYSGDSINVHRATRPPISLRNPCLTTVWMTQPDAARGLLGDERMTASGLLPRFLICDVRADPQHEPEDWPEMQVAAVESWNTLINGLLGYRSSCAEPIQIDADPEARSLLRDFHNRAVNRVKTGGDLRDVDSYVARWGENAWRLSLVLHCASHGGDAHRHSVNAETAQRAIHIMEWFIHEQLSVLAAGRSDCFRARLEKLIGILRESGGVKTLGKLRDANGFEYEELTFLADRFPQQLTIAKLEQPGRPSFVARLTTSQQPRATKPINPTNDPSK